LDSQDKEVSMSEILIGGAAVCAILWLFWLGGIYLLIPSVLIIGLFVLVVVPIWLFDRRRMHYSPDADAALKALAEELQSELLGQSNGILEVEGIYLGGYPKVMVLFGSEHAFEQAKQNGLLDRLANRVADVVRSEAVFGRNRESFDQKQAVWAMTDRGIWDQYVKNSG